MPRVIIHTAKRPFIHTTESGERITICMCGLSLAYPFCDGSHRMTGDEDENTIYLYDPERRRIARINLEDLRRV
ncbi:MAG: CDGSH iron-sulfur domain-containing protein [Thaumarchaeota archaeon]|jgi:CDGSH-type Zn-finger protein|nr:CDGSH iron-sulfur domain-containing protein [Candidatus Geocrenenecus arthurdayi]MCL7390191.1 CDGSH iron-sulfur domain-containing protein [Candidatus Geocrenenecus arthurdayi]MCL7391036.1 CDGSH iron-sulfur domain-containing protein [Candidatus Geocrenenecus arthurdayi]MCL7396742.1 CDGSH iron-sulfur domain-containing protein [Candidatus Geocrenenecus arthurdayi]MCL7402479.1 CDGSH iron-sulfur domain-containing protein [Candidatus Geocrenenecus arthurdayi]